MKIFKLINIIENYIDNISNIGQVKKSAFFRKQAYNNVISLLKHHFDSKELITPRKINDLPLTLEMKEKLIRMVSNPLKQNTPKTKSPKPLKSPRSDLSKSNPSNPNPKRPNSSNKTSKIKNDLTKIMGIGPALAQELISQGLNSTDDLIKPKWFNILPEATKAFLKYQPQRKIPHEEMEKISDKLTNAPDSIGQIYLVGSYRRKTPYSKDFDIMLVSNKKSSLKAYIEYLKKIFSEVFIYVEGDDRVSLIIRHATAYYKLDIFRTPRSEQYSMLLYSTGSKQFNIKMRARAKRMGFLLNQKGLFRIRDSNSKIDIRSERGYFKALDMPYVEPEYRS